MGDIFSWGYTYGNHDPRTPVGGNLERNRETSKTQRHGKVVDLHVTDNVKVILGPLIGLFLVSERNGRGWVRVERFGWCDSTVEKHVVPTSRRRQTKEEKGEQ
jgi:hypothetical protein